MRTIWCVWQSFVTFVQSVIHHDDENATSDKDIDGIPVLTDKLEDAIGGGRRWCAMLLINCSIPRVILLESARRLL